MLPATAWDDSEWGGNRARGWTVLGRVRERQEAAQRARKRAQKTIRERSSTSTYGLMHAITSAEMYRSEAEARWRGGPTVLAFLFALPRTDAIRALDEHGSYLDIRSGDTWDLFFPGYYRSNEGELERRTGAQPVGEDFAQGWYFNARDFDALRRHVEKQSESRWQFTGGVDLVLVNAWVPDRGEILVDWQSTISGSIADRRTTGSRVALEQLVMRISNDLEHDEEDPAYGVSEITSPSTQTRESDAKKVLIGALGGIGAALVKPHLPT